MTAAFQKGLLEERKFRSPEPRTQKNVVRTERGLELLSTPRSIKRVDVLVLEASRLVRSGDVRLECECGQITKTGALTFLDEGAHRQRSNAVALARRFHLLSLVAWSSRQDSALE